MGRFQSVHEAGDPGSRPKVESSASLPRRRVVGARIPSKTSWRCGLAFASTKSARSPVTSRQRSSGKPVGECRCPTAITCPMPSLSPGGGPTGLISDLAAALQARPSPPFLGVDHFPPSRGILLSVSESRPCDSADGTWWEASEWYRRKQPRAVALRLVVDADVPAGGGAGGTVRDVPRVLTPSGAEYTWRGIVEVGGGVGDQRYWSRHGIHRAGLLWRGGGGVTYFSRIRLNPTRRDTGVSSGHLRPCMPRSWALTPWVHHPMRGRVLWRLDRHANHDLELYVVSPSEPDFTGLVEQAGWPKGHGVGHHRLRVVSWSLGIRPAMGFPSHGESSSRRRGGGGRGRVTPHLTVAQQEQWLIDHGSSWGFEVPNAEPASFSVSVRERHAAGFSRATRGPAARARQGGHHSS